MPRDPIVRRIVDVDFSEQDYDWPGRVIGKQSVYIPFRTGDCVWARQGKAMYKGFIEWVDDDKLYVNCSRDT